MTDMVETIGTDIGAVWLDGDTDFRASWIANSRGFGPVEDVTYGHPYSARERDVWAARRYRWVAQCAENGRTPTDNERRIMREVGRIREMADAYAAGWIKGRNLTSDDWTRAVNASYVYGDAIAHQTFLYETEQRVSRAGYGTTWDDIAADMGL